jgi:hypothetical protein
MEYPMEAVTLTQAQWTAIHKPMFRPVLNADGFVKTFSQDILFGPPQDLGLHLKHPFVNQYIRQLQITLNETSSDSVTHDLLLATEQLRLELGLPGSSPTF